jgi:TusA-related sulfurtransferase
LTEKTIIEQDVRGQICPSCLLTTLRLVNEQKDRIRSGQIDFHILTDNRHATTTIPSAMSNMGYTVKVQKEQGNYRIIISRQENGQIA